MKFRLSSKDVRDKSLELKHEGLIAPEISSYDREPCKKPIIQPIGSKKGLVRTHVAQTTYYHEAPNAHLQPRGKRNRGGGPETSGDTESARY